MPLYIAECAPAHQRGSLCFLNDLMIVAGQVTAAGLSTAFFYGEVRDGWRWILGLAAAPAVLMFLGMLLQSESPRWLLGEGRVQEAKEVLQLLRAVGSSSSSCAEAEAELEDMAHGVTEDSGTSYYRFWSDVHIRRALLVGCGLQALQQCSGINTIMYYGATVLQRAGPAYDERDDNCFHAENKHDVATTILFAGGQLLGVFVSWCLVDRVGRRPLVLTSLAGVTTFLIAIGFAFSMDTVSQEAVIMAMMLYLVSFGLGMSPVPWTVNAEIYPLHVRAQCISMSTSTNWAMNFVVAQTFLSLANHLSTHSDDKNLHPDGIFFLYASIAAMGFVLLWSYMPETKGLTLEQIGEVFTKPELGVWVEF